MHWLQKEITLSSALNKYRDQTLRPDTERHFKELVVSGQRQQVER